MTERDRERKKKTLAKNRFGNIHFHYMETKVNNCHIKRHLSTDCEHVDSLDLYIHNNHTHHYELEQKH